jgi:alkylhydroperoxidase family enzyme
VTGPRIEPGGLRELGPVNWVIAKVTARGARVPEFHLFTTLGQNKRLLKAFIPYSAILLGMGKLPRRDSEFVILRIGHLRECEYELQQHRRLARSRGVDSATQALIFDGPHAAGLTDRERALIKATDEFVLDRKVSQDTWDELTCHLDKPQLIEFCLLAAQYDGLAATINTLNVPMDFPD